MNLKDKRVTLLHHFPVLNAERLDNLYGNHTQELHTTPYAPITETRETVCSFSNTPQLFFVALHIHRTTLSANRSFGLSNESYLCDDELQICCTARSNPGYFPHTTHLTVFVLSPPLSGLMHLELYF